ncbi:hypothetical protein KUD11_13420 [Roseovarius sp. LXJ103]|uniref:hypothetical protein n=1 Tax=Roseovarius carneus TaxID=2853164 RepID=UPI000D616A2C|nr:hypothetical protein [Roseovarius carneus]MBZ8119643.1 hypothetical protein [Roseovarius carneus]PWE34742.1 hypothetical protein DD563_01330 [Pelagicola sp. LXJ1103]
MSDMNDGFQCQIGCWAMAAGVGFLTCVMMWAVGDQRLVAAVGVGAVAFAVAGLLFSVIFCRASRGPAVANNTSASASAAPTTTVVASAAAPVAAAASPKAAAPKTAKPKAAPKAAKPKAKPAKAEPAPSAGGKRPEALKVARGGKADNLKEIKGIGPKLEKLCNSLGFYHFDQIAGWSADEIAWVDQNLEGFKGRVSRDQWVAQAKVLAAGGETDFSKRVEGGDVY